MKRYFLFSLSFLLSFPCFSQISVKIGKNNQTVYQVTPNETTDLTELIPLETLFRNKKIVGMGEATHGTKEFFNMKAKMFKFLATHCGYRIFSIEATYGGTLKVNDYVLYKKGNVLDAMKGMEFWTWDTEEVRDLIEWMRTYNEGKAENEKLKFYGFDCQSFKGPTNALVDYITGVDNKNLDKFLKELSVLNDSSYGYFYTLNSSESSSIGIAQVHGIIATIQKWFQEKEEFYIAESGMKKFELAKYNIEALKQAILLRSTPEKEYGFRRDSCMSQNLQWIYKLEQNKIFAWAHNGHICKAPNLFEKHEVCMGMYLDKIFGSDYYNIGFVFNQGSFQALTKVAGKLQEFSVPVYKKNTLTNELALSGLDAFFIDMTITDNKLFRTSGRTYYIGALFMPEYWNRYSKRMIAKNQFDGLIFINKTNCAIPISRKLKN
ncbi:MAG: erythromycin esterase family protein [Bacteroidales bacterium]|nr:erythromycin esterase family protein [Bacteroidales bacterium]